VLGKELLICRTAFVEGISVQCQITEAAKNHVLEVRGLVVYQMFFSLHGAKIIIIPGGFVLEFTRIAKVQVFCVGKPQFYRTHHHLSCSSKIESK